ncbi:MAG: hypothetical protein JXA71_06150 [Chitinispirillaceae bacterium]|nr:hypothetical protein [Chitinispirillaceae bacterium]
MAPFFMVMGAGSQHPFSSLFAALEYDTYSPDEIDPDTGSSNDKSNVTQIRVFPLHLRVEDYSACAYTETQYHDLKTVFQKEIPDGNFHYFSRETS